jgi:hypothetical protein
MVIDLPLSATDAPSYLGSGSNVEELTGFDHP